MKTRWLVRLALFTLCLSALPSAIKAQSAAAQVHPNLARGNGSDKSLERTQWDNIGLFNGNLNLSIPLGQRYPLREGFDYQLVLSYNSNIWDYKQSSPAVTTALPNKKSNAGLGWDISLGRLIDPFSADNGLGKWVYVSPDGALHPFYTSLHYDIVEPDDNVFYTRDGTYYRLQQLNATTTLIESPDGTVRTFELANNEWRLIKIADRFTNNLAINYEKANVWTLTDNHGRRQVIYFKTDPGGTFSAIVDRVVVSSFAGGTATYTFTYTTGTVTRSDVDNDTSTSTTINLSLLTGVTAPDGSKYSFGYHPATAASDASGRLANMQLPTMGKIDWAYQRYNFTSPSCASTLSTIYRANTGIASRRMTDMGGAVAGVWNFVPAVKTLNDPARCADEGEMTNTVTTPLGDKTVHYFSVNVAGTSSASWNRSNYALPLTKRVSDSQLRYLSREILDCDTNGNNCRLLQSFYTRYEQDGVTDPNSPEVANVARREASQRVIYHDDVENGVTRFAGVDRSDFDGLGHFRKEVTHGNFGSGDVREQIIDYHAATGTYPSAGYVMPATNQPWLINIYGKQRKIEGTSSQVIEVCYDRQTGFAKRQRVWWTTNPAGTASNKDALVFYTPDAAGQVVKEQYYGGDVQPVDTAGLCTLPVPGSDQYQIQRTYQYGSLSSSQYYTASGSAFGTKLIDRDFDQNTGLVKTSRDSAGLATQYEYDQLGRITWLKPTAGHGAWTQYYRTLADSANTAKTFIYKKGNGTGVLLTYKADVQDSFGRIWWEQTCMPDGACPSRYTHRDAMGWVTYKSEYSNEAPKYTTYYDHDPFGRPRVARPPDGAHHDTTYQYAGSRSVRTTASVGTSYNKTTGQIHEAPRSTTQVYDRQGRLWKEINHTVDSFGSARDVVTNHSYNVAGQILETKKDGVLIGASRFYDGRGFLQSEYKARPVPETLTFMELDARGNARRSQRYQHAAATTSALASTFDRAGRLLKVSDPNNASKVWKEFMYADANGANDWRAGKLWKAVRYNDMSRFLPQVGVAVVSEIYTYGGIGGKVSQYEIGFADQVGRAEKFNQTYAYTELGDVSEIGYPNDVTGSSYIDIGRERKVNYTYANGLLTSVAGSYNGQSEGWANSISYHPHGLTSQIVHANGVTDNVTKDPNGFVRAAAFSTSGAKYPSTNAPDNININNFQYDGKGALVKAGNQYFVPEAGSQSSPASPAAPYTGPCESGWRDPTGVVYASADSDCNARAFYFYTADDLVFKVEDAIREEKIWHFRDQEGRPLTDYVMAHTHYLPWANTWQYTHDYIYNGGSQLAVHEARRDAPSRRLHYHHGYGARGIVTDQNGFRIQE